MKNLEAAKDYLKQLFQQREQARQTLTDNAQMMGMAMTPDQIEREVEQIIAPFAIPMKDMVRILSHDGGSKNLEAAKDYLAQLFQQCVQLEQQGYSQQQVELAMTPFTINMDKLVSTVAQTGGANRLKELLDSMK